MYHASNVYIYYFDKAVNFKMGQGDYFFILSPALSLISYFYRLHFGALSTAERNEMNFVGIMQHKRIPSNYPHMGFYWP